MSTIQRKRLRSSSPVAISRKSNTSSKAMAKQADIAGPTSFSLFSQLPIELQTEIWEHVLLAYDKMWLRRRGWTCFWNRHLGQDRPQLDRAFHCAIITYWAVRSSFYGPHIRNNELINTCRLSRLVVLKLWKREVAMLPILATYPKMAAALTFGKAEFIANLQHLMDSTEHPDKVLRRELGPDYEKQADSFKQAVWSMN